MEHFQKRTRYNDGFIDAPLPVDEHGDEWSLTDFHHFHEWWTDVVDAFASYMAKQDVPIQVRIPLLSKLCFGAVLGTLCSCQEVAPWFVPLTRHCPGFWVCRQCTLESIQERRISMRAPSESDKIIIGIYRLYCPARALRSCELLILNCKVCHAMLSAWIMETAYEPWKLSTFEL